MPFFTSEIRWFSAKRTPLQKLYNAIPCSEEMESEHRTDHYARGTGHLTGIKMRSELFEGKFKIAPDQIYEQAHGKIEKWVKWSSAETFLDLDLIGYAIRKDWIAVEKKRLMKRFEYKRDGSFICRASMEIERGCAIEITEININGDEDVMHTLCFEAFGEKEETGRILKQSLQYFDPDFSGFSTLVSCGYPEFLNEYREI